MEKLIKGIVQFRETVSKEQLEHFGKIAIEQKPDSLFIACSDSRVVPNLFASTDPGDLFVVRNVGNIIPPAEQDGFSTDDVAEIAAVEYAINALKVKDIIICGHSECGAMAALLNDNLACGCSHVERWIHHAEPSLEILKSERELFSDRYSDVNLLSQINVLQQVEHLKTYPLVQEKLNKGEIRIHAWWFDIATANVYMYDNKTKDFEILK